MQLSEKQKQNDELAKAAIKRADDSTVVGKRIVVFVRKPDDAQSIADSIRKHESTKAKTGRYNDFVEVLTGTMRGLERDELIEKPILKRFLDGDIHPSDESNQQPAFLISTSAGEVGFDLNADHMVCDTVPLDSMIQRLGRVNRRGKGTAIVQVLAEKQSEKKADKRSGGEKQTIATASLNAIEALKKLPVAESLENDNRTAPILDASPRALRDLNKPSDALLPPPTMVELTDILLDAWSMTSITEPMPGRPEVAPWLRGISEWEPPQTTIAWRAELDLPGFDQLDMETIEEWFDTHGIRTHETLSVPTVNKSEACAEKWLKARWKKLGEALGQTGQREIGERPVVVDRAGRKLIKLAALMKALDRNDSSSIRNADLILPASFGGIERHKGLLDADAPEVLNEEGWTTPEELQNAIVSREVAPDVADDRERYRELVTKTEDGESETRPIGSGTKPARSKSSRLRVELESDDGKRVQLVSYVPKAEKPETGSKKQTLAEHVGLVRKHLGEILVRLDLPDALRLAAQLAAEFHDHGKNRERWQRTVDGTATIGTNEWIKQIKLESDGKHQTLGKSGDEMKRDPRGYRHEFGSLREFIDAHKEAKFTDSNGTDITQEVIDVAMHLIATHHGRGRPHFPKGGFDPDGESRSTEIHTEVIRRFARLQRKYGWWRLAWLENLLRCADALASADPDDNAEGNA